MEVPTNFPKGVFDMEEWKPIKDLPGYSVSNKGRVRKDSTGQIMVLTFTGLWLKRLLRNPTMKEAGWIT